MEVGVSGPVDPGAQEAQTRRLHVDLEATEQDVAAEPHDDHQDEQNEAASRHAEAPPPAKPGKRVGEERQMTATPQVWLNLREQTKLLEVRFRWKCGILSQCRRSPGNLSVFVQMFSQGSQIVKLWTFSSGCVLGGGSLWGGGKNSLNHAFHACGDLFVISPKMSF